MARKKTPRNAVNVSQSISERLREVRRELFGEHGGPELARRLGVPTRQWYDYETGVTVPAEILLRFIDETGVNPIYLLTGEGSRFGRPADDPPLSTLSPVELLRRGLEQLERSGGKWAGAPSGELTADYVAVPVFPPEQAALSKLDASASEGEVLAMRGHLSNPTRVMAVRVSDDSMHPVLPDGSIAFIDRTQTDPGRLEGQIVAANVDGRAVIRWLEVSGRHLILRPNRPSREARMVAFESGGGSRSPLIGKVVCSWNRFG